MNIITKQSDMNQFIVEKSHSNELTTIDPKQQIIDIREEEELLGDLNRLSQKYKRYQNENNNNDYNEIIREKDFVINDLKREIDELKQKNIDITILYNTKIENIKTEHKKELYRIHSEFANRLNK